MRLVYLLPMLAACGSQLVWEPTAEDLDAMFEPQPIDIPYESDSMSHRSAGFAHVSGLEFQRTRLSWAGMSSMACKLFTRSAVFDLDVDPDPTDDETVVDANDGVVVTTSTNTVGLIELDGEAVSVYLMPGVIDARISDRGIVSLSVDDDDHCSVNFGVGPDTHSTKVFGDACLGAFAVDPATSAGFVATPEGVLRVLPDATERISDFGDVLAWDQNSDQLYVAARNDLLNAYSADGALLWESKVPGIILDIATLDEVSGSYVLATDGATSTVWWLDPATGEASLEMTVDRVVSDIAASPAGEMLGVVTRGQVDFFDIH